MYRTVLRTLLAVVIGCVLGRSASANELWHLSDEMQSSASEANWTRVFETEAWLQDQLSLWDVALSSPGFMSVTARTSTWLDSRRGPLIYKEVTGDFVVTADLEVADVDTADGDTVPSSTFASVGLMARQPSMITSERFGPAREDYVFVALGTGDNAASGFQWLTGEATDVVTSTQLSPAGSGLGKVQLARVGDVFILLAQSSGGAWQVLRRLTRPDLPATLQVGVMVQADRTRALEESVTTHNHGLIDDGEPDLTAALSYVRYFRPTVPAGLSGLDLANPGEVTAGDLLGFLSDTADAVPGENDLSARVALVGDPVVPETFMCNIAVVNEGVSLASNVTLVFDIDGPVELQDLSGSGWTCAGSQCSLSSLGPGDTSVLDATLRAASGGSAACTATVFNESLDPAPSDNTREASFIVAANPGGGGTQDPPSDGGIDPPAEPPGDPKDYDQIDGQRVGGDIDPPLGGDSDQSPPPGCTALPSSSGALLLVLLGARGWRRRRRDLPPRSFDH